MIGGTPTPAPTMGEDAGLTNSLFPAVFVRRRPQVTGMHALHQRKSASSSTLV
jgi:hypothetical protein